MASGLISDPGVIAGYLRDASNTSGHAEGLLRPSTAAQVGEILAQAQAQDMPVTLSAERTSTTGGPVPSGGWVLSTERFGGLQIQGDQVRVGAAVRLGEIQEAAAEHGLFYPPDPTSWESCSVGGTIACNASGARSFRYGPTRPWVLSAQVVWADGQVQEVDRQTPIPAGWPVPDWTPPAVKNATGFFPADNLLDLIIGSEGTLGLVTAATLRLLPLPEQVFSVLALFPDRRSGLDFVRQARGEGPKPRLIEWYDTNCLELIRARIPELPAQARVAIWLEHETDLENEDTAIMAWAERIAACGGLEDHTLLACDPSSLQKLLHIRHAIPAGINEQVARNGMPKVGTDFSVPDSALEEMMAAYDAVEMDHVLFGHVGDNHLHLNLLPTSPEELEQAWEIWGALYDRALSLGGTLSAEHGVGKVKAPYLRKLVGDRGIQQFVALKRAIDPAWVLGRGTLLAAPITTSV
ncbi:MAG: D-lactate dehydrogenase (cytochrome) [Cognaticolwellia sp.]